MISLGKKMGGGQPVDAKENSKSYMSYPSMSVEKSQMPFLKGKDIDDTFVITVKCKIKSINKYNDGDTCYGIDLVEAAEGKEKSNE